MPTERQVKHVRAQLSPCEPLFTRFTQAHPEGTIGHLGLTAPTTAGSAGGRIDTLRITRPDPGLHWA
ncbi:hypothetical protein, partial [Streptomyces sp. NPDC057496]|uniref:hypothetical protein n=1 Tax=Streptomyces sp. NPDC057496 TaxID=3346149 RepID=UPI003683165B